MDRWTSQTPSLRVSYVNMCNKCLITRTRTIYARMKKVLVGFCPGPKHESYILIICSAYLIPSFMLLIKIGSPAGCYNLLQVATELHEEVAMSSMDEKHQQQPRAHIQVKSLVLMRS